MTASQQQWKEALGCFRAGVPPGSASRLPALLISPPCAPCREKLLSGRPVAPELELNWDLGY